MNHAVEVGVLNPAARRDDFKRLPPPQQRKIAALLATCAEQSLSVRCEAVGQDLYVLVGRGLSAPSHWQEMFGLIPPRKG